MALVFCRGCAKQIHETAPTCPQCGAPQHLSAAPAVEPEPLVVAPANSQVATILGIGSMLYGAACVLTLLYPYEWALSIFFQNGLCGLVLGITCLAQKKSGANMATLGMAISSLSLIYHYGFN